MVQELMAYGIFIPYAQWNKSSLNVPNFWNIIEKDQIMV